MSEKLKAEERALGPARALKLLRASCRDSDWEFLRVLEAQPIKRRPGRRLVILYEVECRRLGERQRRVRLFAKLYRGRKGERVHAAMRRLRSAAPAPLRIPEVLGYSPRWRCLVLEALEGPTLTELLRLPEAALHMAGFADGLAVLHGLELDEPGAGEQDDGLGRIHGPAAEAEVLAKARDRVAAAPFATELRAGYRELLEQVTDRLLARHPFRSSSVIHRDLHPDQVFMCRGQVGLIDLDETCRGEREVDVGNILAHLVLADLQEIGRVGPARLLIRALLERYVACHPLNEDRLVVWQAASLLRLVSLERLAKAGRSVLGWEPLARGLVAEVRRLGLQ